MKKCVYQVKRPISKVNRPVCEAKYCYEFAFGAFTSTQYRRYR